MTFILHRRASSLGCVCIIIHTHPMCILIWFGPCDTGRGVKLSFCLIIVISWCASSLADNPPAINSNLTGMRRACAFTRTTFFNFHYCLYCGQSEMYNFNQPRYFIFSCIIPTFLLYMPSNGGAFFKACLTVQRVGMGMNLRRSRNVPLCSDLPCLFRLFRGYVEISRHIFFKRIKFSQKMSKYSVQIFRFLMLLGNPN